jgi:quinoprotein glucose dehydrogenase/quinate dehydrogenase (quinone)
LIALLLGLLGLCLVLGGAWLTALGGSTYYLIAGLSCLVACGLYLGGSHYALYAVLAIALGTCIWAIAEVGLDFWQLVPRIAWWLVLAVIAVLHRLWSRGHGRALPITATFISLIGAASVVIAMRQLPSLPLRSEAVPGLAAKPTDDWYAFGGTAAGTRFSSADQITPANVSALQPAWTYRTGDLPTSRGPAHVFEATPILAGDTLYVCTSQSIVMALDPDTGSERWRFDPHSDATGVRLSACRGVSFYQAPDGTTDCPRRIIVPTRDGRLFALDAETGQPCRSFGNNGVISLLDGLGSVTPGFAYTTSPPAIVSDTIVLGAMVLDGYSTEEPAGVVRGFNAITGALRWAWDPGAADENPKPGVAYSRGSPNAWSVLSADPSLGLVYVPMGNATPDFVDQHRSRFDDRYSSAVVALDASTGVRQWSFQTVHHDLWDYDVGSQPVLFDMPMPDGQSVPALAQPTKQGDIYILDRRTGKPITEVAERAAPQGSIPGEVYAPTQPYSVGFPSLSPPALRERDMWGATPLDQLGCRIEFRSLEYRGKFTPPSVSSTLQYPGNFGVMDWGSVSIDVGRKLMIVNSSYMPMVNKLIPRSQAPPPDSAGAHGYYSPQLGTPFAADPRPFLSPVGLPCNSPPWGLLTAIDLTTRTVVWQHRFGTTRDIAPLGLALPGAFNLGGAATTASGLTLIAASLDQYLRAFDTLSGRELWRGRLPAGGQAGAMTYVSPKTHRQYVVVAAGGHQLLKTGLGDYVQAFALPQSGKPP